MNTEIHASLWTKPTSDPVWIEFARCDPFCTREQHLPLVVWLEGL